MKPVASIAAKTADKRDVSKVVPWSHVEAALWAAMWAKQLVVSMVAKRVDVTARVQVDEMVVTSAGSRAVETAGPWA